MSSVGYSDDPSMGSNPPPSSLEVEQGVDAQRDGLIMGDPTSLRVRICRSRNLAIIFLLVLAFFLVGTDIFESTEISLPGDDVNTTTPLSNAMDSSNKDGKHEEDGSELLDDDDGNEDDVNTTTPLSNAMDSGNKDGKHEEDGSELIDDDDDNEDDDGDKQNEVENNNVVDLNAKNRNRDGVEFISPTCNYTCMTDRLPHESPLYPGHVLCNREHRFGMTKDGDFFFQDCLLDTVKIIWSAKDAQLTSDQYPIHFELQKNGYFQIISDPTGQILLEAGPKRNVTYHYMCLHHKPKLDCPYLHLHPDGVLVLNWIDNHKWVARNVKQQYLGLFPDSD